MVEILVAAYLIVGLFVAVMLWTVLIVSKRSGEIQMVESKPVKHDPSHASMTEPIHRHSS
jgi:hypothetical protein